MRLKPKLTGGLNWTQNFQQNFNRLNRLKRNGVLSYLSGMVTWVRYEHFTFFSPSSSVPAGVQITNHVTTPHVITVFLEQTPGVTKWVVAMKEVGSNASHTLQDLPSSEENFKHSYVATSVHAVFI